VRKYFYLTTFAGFIAHIRESLYGDHTFAKIEAKDVRLRKFAQVAFVKKDS
jgi:hypothetical protein